MKKARKKAEFLLDGKYTRNGIIIDELFMLQDEIRTLYNTCIDNEGIHLNNLIFTKTARLLDGVYILIKENLGQESGALLRPAIEGIELLEYLKEYPEGYEQALTDKLPKAGVIAQKIQGRFKPLRDYLNEDASHFNISTNSMINLINKPNSEIIYDDDINENVFITNLKMISLFLLFMNYQGMQIDKEKAIVTDELIEKHNSIRARLGIIYNLENKEIKDA